MPTVMVKGDSTPDQKADYLRTWGSIASVLPFYPSTSRMTATTFRTSTVSTRTIATLETLRSSERGTPRYSRYCRPRNEHTSDQHPCSKEARSSPDSPRRDYTSGATPRTGTGTPDISLTRRSPTGPSDRSPEVFLAPFFSHQPDLNYDNPAVQEA